MNLIAQILFAIARRLIPAPRREWVDAMRAETAHLSDLAATHWAFGCVLMSLRERFRPMNTGDFRISRWVMLVETFACFGPITLGWLAVVFGETGLARHWDYFSGRFPATPGGSYIFALLLCAAVAGLVGPVGLFLGLRLVTSGRVPGRPVVGNLMLAVPLVFALVACLGYFAGPSNFRIELESAVLFVLLPVVGTGHLLYLGHRAPPRPPAVASA